MPMGTAVARRSTLAANFGRGPTSAPQYFLQLFLGNSAEVSFQGASLSKNQRGAMKSALNVAINMDLALRRHTARNRQVVAEG